MTKPFAFIPLIEGTVPRKKPIGHHKLDKYKYSGKLKVKITSLTPLHISSGAYGIDEKNNVYKATVKRNKRPVIPGSSIKGVIRTIAEAVSRSCSPRKPDERNHKSDCDNSAACITCRMFGFLFNKQSYRGQVKFSEFEVTNYSDKILKLMNLPELFKPQKSHFDVKRNIIGRKFYYHSSKQQLGNLPFEVVTINTKFVGDILFENLSKDELSLLAFSIGIGKNFNLKIGYAKPAYFGSIDTELIEFSLSPYSCVKDLGINEVCTLAKEYGQSDPELKVLVNRLCEVLDFKNQGPDWINGIY